MPTATGSLPRFRQPRRPQLAGFRHVVASLWPLSDRIAADAARAFYRLLPGRTGADGAAEALRAVSLGLRGVYPDRPDSWASLVHSDP
ncbi:CHAT domain-containing protein [Amycolatopsis sp. OK19-0408]|uniref:CHAT domain-containing protein n=2 Tax=Amycolatopsis iheyensis TaxID=2945988 RepID=A0A9X2NNS8_9PSEU|nr:CHAT domain-containing protein [Amycolatopsis iheyensis]